MIKPFLRWWYTITGQKQEAEQMLALALYAMLSHDDGKGYELWQRAYGQIHDTCKEECPAEPNETDASPWLVVYVVLMASATILIILLITAFLIGS